VIINTSTLLGQSVMDMKNAHPHVYVAYRTMNVVAIIRIQKYVAITIKSLSKTFTIVHPPYLSLFAIAL